MASKLVMVSQRLGKLRCPALTSLHSLCLPSLEEMAHLIGLPAGTTIHMVHIMHLLIEGCSMALEDCAPQIDRVSGDAA